ncbi:MAG: formylmethanofuran dehydrogenase, partial [Acidobacteria bacterium]
PEEFPEYKGDRVVCEVCGEGINFRREVRRDGRVLCRACAGTEGCYYQLA